MFNKDFLLRCMYSLLISLLITIIVLMTTYDNTEVLLIILKGMFAGVSIWFVGELLFPLCEKIFPHSVIPGYVVLIILIFGGTGFCGYLFGVKSMSVLIKMCVAAEIFGLGITVIYRRQYVKELNDKLEKNKKEQSD
jgi:hypothetical protein